MDRGLLLSARSGPARRGKAFLVKYLEGENLTRMQAMDAKCYECSGMGDSSECNIESCPLYPFSHFGGLKQRLARAGTEKQAIVEVVTT